jgi:hypothetical protein
VPLPRLADNITPLLTMNHSRDLQHAHVSSIPALRPCIQKPVPAPASVAPPVPGLVCIFPAVMLLLTTSISTAQTYNPATGFSATSNPNGVWRYGYSLTLGSPLILHTNRLNSFGVDIWRTAIALGVPAAFHNPTANAIGLGTPVIDAGGLALHPGPQNQYGILRFTAPLAGDYRISGSWYGQDITGTTTDVHILANGVQVFAGAVNGFGPGTGPSFNTTASLGEGGYLDFAVGFGANGDFLYDSTGLSAQITMVPEPQGHITSFSSQPNWLAAAGGPDQLTVFSFQGPAEIASRSANDPNIQPSYASQGVVFLPFRGTTIYPAIARNQQFQISSPNHDGLLINQASPNPVSDLIGRAIRFDFTIPVRSVGLNFNGPYLDGDRGYLEAFDYSGDLIGRTSLSANGGFIGLVADTEISRVHVVNTGGPDIRFGIWDLQFKEVPVTPEFERNQTGSRLSWPATAQNYVLEESDNLQSTSWALVTTQSLVVDDKQTVQIQTTPARRFFRLRRQ